MFIKYRNTLHWVAWLITWHFNDRQKAYVWVFYKFLKAVTKPESFNFQCRVKSVINLNNFWCTKLNISQIEGLPIK